MKDTEKRDKYKVYGELINTYGYGVEEGARSMEAMNYYTNEIITIPLDPLLTPSENAKKYFDKYGKLKRTYEALSELTIEVKQEIEHLESILTDRSRIYQKTKRYKKTENNKQAFSLCQQRRLSYVCRKKQLSEPCGKCLCWMPG